MKFRKFLLAPDSFKECMTAKEVCEAMAAGIHTVFPNATCTQIPMADGGEGTMQALVDATQGCIHTSEVCDPLGNKIIAPYGILGDGTTAIIEMASASGLHLVPVHLRDPQITSTFGTGQLILAACRHPISKLLIGIGGSATNDGGTGMARALGIKFLNKEGTELEISGGGMLSDIASIDTSEYILKDKNIQVEVACDVTNPLTGPLGATNTFAKQKGANDHMILELEHRMAHYEMILQNHTGLAIGTTAGAGAAGGLGAGLLAFLNAKLVKGIDLVINYTNIESYISDADIVFTGEGSIDHQTQYGKTPFGVAQLAQKYKKPVIAFAGKVGDVNALYDFGIDTVFSIMQSVSNLQDALKQGKPNMEATCERVCRLLNLLQEAKEK